MTITVRAERDVTVVEVKGDLDATRSAEFGSTMEGLVRHGCRHFVIDLQGVTFIDSTGLSALIRCLKRTQGQQGAFCLTGLQPAVRRALELTHLARAFDIYPLVTDAVQALAVR